VIYNDIKNDREKEKEKYFEELEKRKKKSIAEIKQRSLESKDLTLRNMEIERLKQEITNIVMGKILTSMTPSTSKKSTIKKHLGKTTVFSAFDDEERDVIKEDDIKLNRRLQKSVTAKGFIKRSFPKRFSKGDLGNLKFTEKENNDNNNDTNNDTNNNINNDTNNDTNNNPESKLI